MSQASAGSVSTSRSSGSGWPSLLDGYDGVLLDLDGTLYRGQEAISGAVAAVDAVQRAGRIAGYVTNNASRSPAEVSAHLARLGFAVDAEHVVTSAQAAAALLAEKLSARADALVVGTDSLAAEVQAVGLVPVRACDGDGPAAVVQGHSPQTGWPILAEACLAVRAGALWVACNLDPTLPAERGQLPGNGSRVAALRAATGAEPVVAGKPERRLMDEASARLGMRRPLVVGDRLDTDIAGGNAAKMDTLLVLTGVSTAADLLAAPPHQRPRFVAADLGALFEAADHTEIADHPGWEVRPAPGTALLSHRGTTPPDPLQALRALCAACWAAGVAPAEVHPSDNRAAKALSALALP